MKVVLATRTDVSYLRDDKRGGEEGYAGGFCAEGLLRFLFTSSVVGGRVLCAFIQLTSYVGQREVPALITSLFFSPTTVCGYAGLWFDEDFPFPLCFLEGVAVSQ